MPLIRVETSLRVSEDVKSDTIGQLSGAVSKITGKAENYIATIFAESSSIAFGGELKDAAFVLVRGIGGLDAQVNRELSAAICGILKETLGIDPLYVYINFENIAASNWGWNSSTFG